jgi:hypothetical protein
LRKDELTEEAIHSKCYTTETCHGYLVVRQWGISKRSLYDDKRFDSLKSCESEISVNKTLGMSCVLKFIMSHLKRNIHINIL